MEASDLAPRRAPYAGQNWPIWSMQVKMRAQSKGQLRFYEGETPRVQAAREAMETAKYFADHPPEVGANAAQQTTFDLARAAEWQ